MCGDVSVGRNKLLCIAEAASRKRFPPLLVYVESGVTAERGVFNLPLQPPTILVSLSLYLIKIIFLSLKLSGSDSLGSGSPAPTLGKTYDSVKPV